jgi:hypothetical protein
MIEFSIRELGDLLQLMSILKNQMSQVENGAAALAPTLTAARAGLVAHATAVGYSDAQMTAVVGDIAATVGTLSSLIATMQADIAIVDAKMAEISG